MSWTQGIQIREDLPQAWIDFFEAKALQEFEEPRKVEYITWFAEDESRLIADYGDGFNISFRMKDRHNDR